MPSSSTRAVITGASGFVGRALMARMPGEPLALGRDDWNERIAAARWDGATVYHLAARVHGQCGNEADYQHDNVDKTRALVEAAERGGARRLVFLSSIKVNGEETRERPFRPDDPPAPEDAYARSKAEAERVLREISSRGKLSISIVRAPLVIGVGAAGNLRALLRLADTPWPLPFGAIENRRTFVGVEDLARLLLACGDGPRADGRTFLAGDPEPMSTPRLIATIRAALGRNARMIRLDVASLEAMASLAGARERIRRLTRSLEADVSDTLRELAWSPSMPIGEVVAKMARAYHAEGASS
jgi:nucleoside-diphosphate-sugar epimerase